MRVSILVIAASSCTRCMSGDGPSVSHGLCFIAFDHEDGVFKLTRPVVATLDADTPLFVSKSLSEISLDVGS